MKCPQLITKRIRLGFPDEFAWGSRYYRDVQQCKIEGKKCDLTCTEYLFYEMQ